MPRKNTKNGLIHTRPMNLGENSLPPENLVGQGPTLHFLTGCGTGFIMAGEERVKLKRVSLKAIS